MPLPDFVLTWRPPEGFHQVESRVNGITVYAPEPPDDQHVTAQVTYKCPQCGATTRYDVAAGGIACEHCGYSAPVVPSVQAPPSQASEFTLENLERAQHGWGLARREMHCDSCGAVITIAETDLTATCPFCASNKVNVQAASNDFLRPGFVIPFKVETGQIRQTTQTWLGKGWFHPSDLANAVTLDHMRGVYLPYWAFDAQINAHWTAEVGYEHEERYFDSDRKEWRTRTKIEWRFESGNAGLGIHDYLEPGTHQVSQVILKRIQDFSMVDLTGYTPDCLAGWQAQAYDVPLETAWETSKTVMRDRARDACNSQIHSNHIRNFQVSADFADETWRYTLLPVYIAAYRYQDRVFQIMANGQTGQVNGQKPVAWWKVFLVIALLLLPGVLLGLFDLLNSGGESGLLFLAAVLVGIAGLISFQVYRSAVNSEAV